MKGWSNLRSFTPLESKKGKMYAEYTNVGECHGENVTMRIWLEDWQNTVVPSGYEDVDAVVVAIALATGAGSVMYIFGHMTGGIMG